MTREQIRDIKKVQESMGAQVEAICDRAVLVLRRLGRRILMMHSRYLKQLQMLETLHPKKKVDILLPYYRQTQTRVILLTWRLGQINLDISNKVHF